MSSKKKLWLGVVSGLFALVVLLVGVKGGQIVAMMEAGASFAPPPEAVSAARVEKVEWVGTRPAIGSLVADRGVTLSAELPGTVRQISFRAGSSVEPGQVLVRLDTSTEEAQLVAARADASLARQNLERARILRETESNTRADLDAAEARAASADAQVATLEATIAKKNIRAPFAGRISIRQVELGQYVAPGQPIASLQSVTPIHAEFSVPQQVLAELRPGQQASLRTDAFPGSSWKGTVTTVNPEVDVATRTVRVRATFGNDDGRLRPGMFANVELFSEGSRPALIIPATAVLYAPYGDSVFALEEKKDEATGRTATVARQKFVRLGDRRGDFVAVVSGLEAGETVVSAGAFKLRNGTAVAVQPDLAPDPELAPTPKDQ
ncbi:MAG TPA: efflux RND transporter periplasmic adaptor subunit [Anaeromyxobacteraceae bacterium]|nr:efflux RND transporter periplasmic adaptor subunit [Anaeromyxobacteraceae bacterium]